ncbi:MAG: cytochrome C oxidase subunit IV family protein [Stappiaceae bacterium]
MRADSLDRAWIILIVLSGGSAIAASLAGVGFDRRIAAIFVLLFALIKGRIILSRYLGLSQAPTWQRGFTISLTLFCLLLLGLYMIPAFMV